MAITLERCAEMRAEMDAGRLRDEVLARAGLSTDEWTLGQREWLDKMGTDLARGRYELTNRYTQAFLDRQRELAAASAAFVGLAEPRLGPIPAMTGPALDGGFVPGPLPLPLPPPMAPPPRPAPAHEGGAAGAPPAEVRSPWATEADAGAKPPAPPPEQAIDLGEETGMPRPSPLRGVLPFRPAGAGPVPLAAPGGAPPARPVARPAPADLSGTMIGAISPFASVLPFAPGAASPAPAPAPAPGVAGAAGGPITGSMPAVNAARALPFQSADPGAGPAAVPGRALPFQQAQPADPGAGPAAAPGRALPFQQAQPAEPAATPAAAPGRALPFQPAEPSATPAAAPPAAEMPPRAATLPRPASPPRPAPAPPPPRVAATPAAAPAAPLASLTLEQHASLCAEIAHAPALADAALTRYRVTPAAKAEMDQAWKARFAADPALEAKWHEAYRLYFTFLASARRG